MKKVVLGEQIDGQGGCKIMNDSKTLYVKQLIL